MAPAQMPTWWAYLFSGWTVMGMGGLIYANLTNPLKVFGDAWPKGLDKTSDALAFASKVTAPGRVDYVVRSSVGSFIYILGTEALLPLVLKGVPAPYQRRVMGCMIYPALLSDAFLVGLTIWSLPPEVAFNPSGWSDGVMGTLVFVPIGSLIKLLWVFGVGAKKEKTA